MAASELFDVRVNLWKESFAHALPYSEYVATGTQSQQDKWRAYRERLSVSPEQKKLGATFKRDLNILVLSGMWCGDCARQGPMLDAIASVAPMLKVRFIDNQAIPQLRDELRIHGAARVPVAVSLSEDFFEVGRSGDRQLVAYQRKARTELGDACDAGIVPPSPDELAEELGQWFAHFERHQLLLRVSPFLRRRHND